MRNQCFGLRLRQPRPNHTQMSVMCKKAFGRIRYDSLLPFGEPVHTSFFSSALFSRAVAADAPLRFQNIYSTVGYCCLGNLINIYVLFFGAVSAGIQFTCFRFELFVYLSRDQIKC